MATQHSRETIPPALHGKYRFVYLGGRILQGCGLLLIWWVLLLFANTSDLAVVLYSGFALAIVAFYLGVACTKWARKTQRSVPSSSEKMG